MTHLRLRNRNQSKISSGKLFMPPLLLVFALLLTGCGPEEKTLLLPQASLLETESEETESVRDFTVKKLYTYTYETRSNLEQSAFLQGAGENEIYIISQSQEDADNKMEYRQVDYRYGFYDTVGDFFWTWEEWSNPEDGVIGSDLYIDMLLPSPDGKQLLVYVRSAFWDTLSVWLYTLGEPRPRLLYEGTAATEGPLIGSFSPSGRWVTFDAGGATTGHAHLVPIYDCEKDTPAEAPDSWSIPSVSAQLNPPDNLLSTEGNIWNQLWDAALFDSGDKPILLLINKDVNSSLGASAISPPERDIIPDASLLLGKESLGCLYRSCYLPGYEGMPYPQYSFSSDGNELTYLGTPSDLWQMNMETFESSGKPIQFPNLVWNFLRLDSGDLLVALAQETGTGTAASSYSSTRQKDKNSEASNSYLENRYNDCSLSVAIQQFWNIKSSDLYLYPEGETEGHLLYKNLQNLINMEYDEATGRILLETYEGSSLSHRRCIILEL